MNALTPLAVTNADVLRVVADQGPLSIAAVAKAVERDSANMRKTLKVLAEANLVRLDVDGWTISDGGRAALQAITRAEDPDATTAALEGIVALHHAQILPDPLNPRRDFESDDATHEIVALADDIEAHGLMQNLVVRAAEPPNDYMRLADARGADLPYHRLISGERRYRAIELLIKRGAWPADKLIPCQVVETDDLGHRIRALSENLQRRNLNPLEEAKAYKALVELLGSTAIVAERVNVVQRQVQMRLQLLELTPEDQARLTLPKDDPDYLSVSEARRILRGTHEDSDAISPASDGRPLPEVNLAAETPQAPGPAQSVAALPDLTPAQELMLVEVSDYIVQKPAKDCALGPTRTLDRLPDWTKDQDLAALVAAGFVNIKSSWPVSVSLLRQGSAYLGRLRFSLFEPAERLRKARTDAGMLDEVIERLETDEEYATAWLNPTGTKPVRLEPAQFLILLEIYDATSKRPKGDQYHGAEVRWDYPRDAVQALRPSFIQNGQSPNWQDQRFYIRVGYEGDRSLEKYYPGHDKAATRREYLDALRTEVLGDQALDLGEAPYATEWLNGPFPLSPEAQAKLDQDAANKRRQEETAAAMEAARKGLDDAQDAFERDLPTLEGEDLRRRVIELLRAYNAPTPWTPGDGGWSTSANGAQIRGGSRSLRLAVVALNILAGVPSDQRLGADVPEDLARHEFVDAAADQLRVHRPDLTPAKAKQWAARELDFWLQSEGVDYGAEGHEWTATQAIDLANEAVLQEIDDTLEPADEDDVSQAETQVAAAQTQTEEG